MVPDDSGRIPRAPPYSGAASTHVKPSDTGLSPSADPLPMGFSWLFMSSLSAVLQPRTMSGLGSSAFARRYLRNRLLFLFLQVLRCFSSLRLASSCLCIRHVIHGYDSVWVPPFGYRRLFTCLPLTVAFRCLLRPSSPECA